MSSILVVEDEDHLREAIGAMLALDGYDVSFATSGKEAVRLCQERAMDLVITDLVMPDMDGLELIRSLRLSHSNLPVLAISGASKDLLEMATALGAVGALQKPFARDDLLAIVRTILWDQRHANERPGPATLLCPRCKAVIYYDLRGNIEAKNICQKCKTIIPELNGKLIVAFERPGKGRVSFKKSAKGGKKW
jgi:DNA-binding response OmpR family regulator